MKIVNSSLLYKKIKFPFLLILNVAISYTSSQAQTYHIKDTVHADTVSLNINLNRNEMFRFAYFSDNASNEIIDNVLAYKKVNKIENLRSFSYSTYNKYTFSTSKNENANKLLNQISKTLPL